MPIEHAASQNGLHGRPISVQESYKRHRAACAGGCYLCGRRARSSRHVAGQLMAFCSEHAAHVFGEQRRASACRAAWERQKRQRLARHQQVLERR